MPDVLRGAVRTTRPYHQRACQHGRARRDARWRWPPTGRNLDHGRLIAVRKPRRLSDEAAAVLDLFVSDPDRSAYGREIVEATEIRSGSLYPILHRLEAQGLLCATWEPLDDALAANRRPRCFYRLDPDDAERARSLLAEWRSARRRSGESLSAPRFGTA
jgi:PadR family transcriptional regulator, regulatory protein PadR